MYQLYFYIKYMKIIKKILVFVLVFSSLFISAQQRPDVKKIKITGTIVEKISKQPLEYATIALINTKYAKAVFGGMTDNKGQFSIDVFPGTYTVKVEFISFKPLQINQKTLTDDTDLGSIGLTDDSTQLQAVVVQGQKSSVEIKLDKKVYNVGEDLTAKGGTASDVLDNVPSVTVDGDGNVSLRGNDDVKILIDGKPSNAINISDALKTISADALDKIEVITNPSARYDAEGGAGIINIILKKGKNDGINGTLIASVGNPKNNNLNANINYKTKQFNLFTTIGYTDSESFGKTVTNSNYTNPDGTPQKAIDELINRTNLRKGYNYMFGMDWYLTNSLTWTNSLSYRKSDGSTPTNDNLNNYDPANTFVQNRYTDQQSHTNDAQYQTNFTKKFKKDGHKLTVDGSFSKDIDDDPAIITTSTIGSTNSSGTNVIASNQSQNKNSVQIDYVLPLGKSSQFEAGYKGDFNELLTVFKLDSIAPSGMQIVNTNYSNTLDYKEKINAVYTQFGSKIDKFSYLFGVRYEDSNIDVDLLTTNNFTNKRYHNFFPSAFLTYQTNDVTSFSLNYSRRIARPRTRFLNPFSNYTSNVNLFQGNPNLDPSLTHAVDLSVLTKLNKLTLTASLYFNKTSNYFTFIRRPNGDVVNSTVNGLPVTTPVYVSTPVNLDNENRYGLEFNINYTPFKWWRLNGNFNFFQSAVTGNYSYTLIGSTQPITINADKTASSWFGKINSKISLPYKIDWQTNATYTAPQNNSQGKSLGVLSANLAFSKDVLKDKATISLNVNDVFNSRKRINEVNLPELNSYSEMQFRQRQINLSFTYRFNKLKTEKEKQPKQQDNGDNSDYSG